MSQRSTAQHYHTDTPFCTIRKSHVTWNFAVPGPHSEEIRRCILLFLCTLAVVYVRSTFSSSLRRPLILALAYHHLYDVYVGGVGYLASENFSLLSLESHLFTTTRVFTVWVSWDITVPSLRFSFRGNLSFVGRGAEKISYALWLSVCAAH